MCLASLAPKFNPQNPWKGDRREQTTQSCSLTSACEPWHVYTCTRAHRMPYVEGTMSPACKFDYTSMAQTVTSLLHCPSDTGDMVRLTFMSLSLFFFFCCECFLVKLCPSGCMLGGYQAGVTRMQPWMQHGANSFPGLSTHMLKSVTVWDMSKLYNNKKKLISKINSSKILEIQNHSHILYVFLKYPKHCVIPTW